MVGRSFARATKTAAAAAVFVALAAFAFVSGVSAQEVKESTSSAPRITVSGLATAVVGEPYEIDVTVEGIDQAITEWTVVWGDGAVDRIAGSPGTAAHVYETVGSSHEILVSVTDGTTTWTSADAIVPHYDTVDGVGRYELPTGSRITELSSTDGSMGSAFAAVIGPAGHLYVTGSASNTVERFDVDTNSHVGTFVRAGSGGLDGPAGLAFGPDGNLYVTSSRTGQILLFDGRTGAFLDTFVDAGRLAEPVALTFDADGSLVVADRRNDVVERFDGATGEWLETFAAFDPGASPSDLLWTSAGNMLVALEGAGRVDELDGVTGGVIRSVATDVAEPTGIAIGPDGYLWVAEYWTDRIVRFDAKTGTAVDKVIVMEAPAGPRQFTFAPDLQVTVEATAPQPARLESAPSTSEPELAPLSGETAIPAPSVVFEANEGQFDPVVDYFARGAGHSVFLADGTTTILVDEDDVNSAYAIRMDLVGGSTGLTNAGVDQQVGRVNYFIGDDPAKWRTDVATYRQVEYLDAYPGIDLRYYGNEREIEYDFVVQPGSDPSTIALTFDGETSLSLDADRDLVVGLDNGRSLTFSAPITYQEVDGKRVDIASGYALDGSDVRFKVDTYDPKLPLVIDPVLQYSTEVGGTQVDRATDIAVDAAGNTYITGHTQVASYPTTVGPQGPGGSFDIMVTKLSANGSSLLYSTLVGGSGVDGADAIAVDPSGSVYVAADSNSANFPMVNAYDSTLNGAYDAVFFRLDPTGTTLLYSTYWGGSGGFDQGLAIAIDASGDAVMAGTVDGSGMPTTAGVVDSSFGGASEAYVVKFDPTQTGFTSLLWATYLGGSDEDEAWGIDLDGSDNVYVGGSTKSTDFPLNNPYQATNGGDNDGWVAMVDPTATSLVYSTYVGGDLADEVLGLDEDSGLIYATGYTNSTGATFPTTAGAYQTVRSASWDMILMVVDPGASGAASLQYSTLVGGDGLDRGNDIAVDSNGTAIATGYTFSTDYPTTGDAYDSSLGSTWDAFITAVYPLGGGASDLAYSTYIGGSTGGGDDSGAGIALDGSDDIYIAGDTGSTNFPTTTGPHGPGGDDDAFVMKFSSVAASPSTTLAVNSTGDGSDTNVGNGTCDTGGTNSQGATECTLRAALEEANALAGTYTIEFDMPSTEAGHSGGVWTIAPSNAFPAISSPAIIDAATQTGYSGSPIVILDGGGAGPSDGLVLDASADGTTVRGFLIRDWSGDGIEIRTGSDGNTITANYIGSLTATGVDAGGAERNSGYGIRVLGATNLVGGPASADGNVISGNGTGSTGGIFVSGASASGTVVQHNLIGTDSSGATAVMNNLHGIRIQNATNTDVFDNLVSGNNIHGVYVFDNGSTGTEILRNTIGTNAGATAALPNGFDGIRLEGGSTNTVIGSPGNGNVIAGNSQEGITINDNNANTIQANFIGTDSTGTQVLGNGGHGIFNEAFGSSNNLIGGPGAGEGNTIAHNTIGVWLDSGTDNTVIGNDIYDNSGLGIDLDVVGVTGNDPGDADPGPNDLLNHPTITSAGESGGTVTVDFDLDVPAGDYRIEAFTNPGGADGTGYGEGEVFEASTTITHTGSGAESFQIAYTGAVGDVITLTATEESAGPVYGATSEFGPSATATGSPRTLSGTVYEDVDGDGSLVDGVGVSGVQVWVFADQGNGEPDAGDAIAATTVTAGGGAWSADVDGDGTYWVAIDSSDIEPAAGYNATFGIDDVWADQTYASAGAVTWNGATFSYSGSAGPFFGGKRAQVADGFPSLADAQHIVRAIAAGGNVTGIDTGYSFAVITNTLDEVSAGSFTDTTAWAAYDPGANGVGVDPDGYRGVGYDGRYIYFAP